MSEAALPPRCETTSPLIAVIMQKGVVSWPNLKLDSFCMNFVTPE